MLLVACLEFADALNGRLDDGFEDLEQLLSQLWSCELSDALALGRQDDDATVAGVADVPLHCDDLLHGLLCRGIHEALSQELVELYLAWDEHVHDDLCPDSCRLICNFLNHD